MEKRTFTYRSLKVAFLSIVGAFLFFPLGNDLLNLVPEDPPHGMAGAAPPRPFSIEGFYKRTWQRSLEPRAKRDSGLWTPLTLIANDLYSRLFGQIAAFPNGNVMQGNARHLIQGAHLPAMNRRKPKKLKELPARIERLKELQDRLKARGKNLIVLVSPNVTEIYPEVVPEIYLDPTRHTRPHPFERLKVLLDKHGITYIDTAETLRQAKAAGAPKLFPPSGSHWNDLGSCLALKAANEKLKSVGGPALRGFTCDDVRFESPPRDKDRDLVKIANVLTPERFEEPTPYVNISYTEPPPPVQPTALLVGTSYLFALVDHLYEWDLAKDSRLYFYFKQWRKGGERKFYIVRPERLDWSELLSRDIIVVNVGIGKPTAIGYGFIEAALQWLRSNP
ncbi:MAG: hypothetical protein RL417_862 [Pseudomonadota bacterium]|jgi:hypothetical protein